MKTKATLQTRRSFLRTTVLGGALSWTVPTFLANTFSALEADAADKATQIVTGKDSTILVVLQMAGGNDGINTVVPHSSDYYYKARPKIGIAAKDVLKISDQVGFHPGLKGFKELYDGGHLAVIQGVGYPNPNRSHFRSTEIWQTASGSKTVEKYGWIGRYFDNACAGCDPTVGVSIGHQMAQSFVAKTPTGISLSNPRGYRFISGDHPRRGQPDVTEESYLKLNGIDASMDDNSGCSIAAISGATFSSGSALSFLERNALDAQISSEKIQFIASRVENQATYPESHLANGLKLVAKLIGGGLTTRVFYVSQGGYDTHSNQTGTHDRLLKDLGDSVKAFYDDMKAQGNSSRVLLMTFSEFGRRVSENASGGTDHGAAAPMFLLTEKPRAGLLGTYPSLAPKDLFEGDIKFNVDFRSVYCAVLENWLKTRSQPILGRQFQPLQVV